MPHEPLIGDLLISPGPGEWRAAWVENGAAVELYVERGETKPAGSRHLGRVVRVVAALDAALVDIGDDRPGFLPLRDVPDGIKTEEGARIIVEVRREAWQDKAPRLSAKITAPDLAERAAQLDPPARLAPAPGLAAALALRLSRAPSLVATDDTATLVELRGAFPKAEIVHRAAADWPVDLDALFETALSSSLALGQGGTVHIEETRTATLIDVDSGTPATGSAERVALAANRAAAALIARELRRRNIGGAVVIDFIGLDRRGHREQVRQALEAGMASDPAKPQILGWTRLGHLELMRSRRGRSLGDAMLEPRSQAKRPLAVACEALRQVLREARATPAANWQLTVSRRVDAVLRGPAASALQALEARLGRRIAVVTIPEGEDFDIRAV
jgi:ribonuclease G